jgi:hypothetical protein
MIILLESTSANEVELMSVVVRVTERRGSVPRGRRKRKRREYGARYGGRTRWR